MWVSFLSPRQRFAHEAGGAWAAGTGQRLTAPTAHDDLAHLRRRGGGGGGAADAAAHARWRGDEADAAARARWRGDEAEEVRAPTPLLRRLRPVPSPERQRGRGGRAAKKGGEGGPPVSMHEELLRVLGRG